MPSTKNNPCIQVDPLNLEGENDKEHIQLALQAVTRNGFKGNGWPWLSLREAANFSKSVKPNLLHNSMEGRKNRKLTHMRGFSALERKIFWPNGSRRWDVGVSHYTLQQLQLHTCFHHFWHTSQWVLGGQILYVTPWIEGQMDNWIRAVSCPIF